MVQYSSVSSFGSVNWIFEHPYLQGGYIYVIRLSSNYYRFGQHYSDETLKLTLRSPINIQLANDFKTQLYLIYYRDEEEGERYPTAASRFSLTQPVSTYSLHDHLLLEIIAHNSKFKC